MASRKIRYFQSRLVVLFLVVLLPASASSQVIGNGYNNSLIYKIHGEKNTVYLLGSIHVLAEEYYPLTRAFSYAYYNSQKVVFEIDPEILFSTSIPKKFEKMLKLPKGQSLKTVLSPKTYGLLKKTFEDLGADWSQIHQYKPWVMYLMLGVPFDSSVEFRADLGIENHFFRMAKDAGKETGGLESIKDQLNVFDKLSLTEQDQLLWDLLSLKDSKDHQKAFLKMVKDWHQGNLDDLEKMVEAQKKYPKFYKAILVDRNRNWIPQIEAFLKEENNVLIVVGAAHLAGKDGLITLLHEKGHTLERVSFARP
ncbi:MAG: TraB/GumN family protein [Nitrospirales bacterium]|nr:TraB/GumN family protein [Nitrospirales bacterium]